MYIALYEDGRYSKVKVENGHLVRDAASDDKFVEIYDVWTKSEFGFELTEKMLKSFDIPNLGYIKTNTGFIVYNTSMEEYIEEELPVYVDVLGKVIKAKKTIMLKIPTERAVISSKVISYKIRFELEKIRNKVQIEFIKKLVQEGDGIAYINTRMNYIYDLFNILHAEGIKVLFSYEGLYVIGSIATKPVLDLYVPKTIVPMVIGKGGERIKKIATEVKAKRINVHPIEP